MFKLILTIFIVFTMSIFANFDDRLIPRKIIFGNPDKANVQISKDGKYISYLSNKSGVLNIFIAPISDINNVKSITNDTKRGIRNYFWSYDNSHILYLKDNDGDENERIHKIDINTLKDKIITPKNGVKAIILKDSYKFPNEIVIGLNQRKKEYFDVYKLNIQNDKLSLMYENNKYISFSIDDNYQIKFGHHPMENGGNQIYLFNDKVEVPFLKISHEDSKTTGIVGFTEKGDKAYFISSIDRDVSGLFLLDLKTKNKELIYSNAKADIENIVLQPKTKQLQAISYSYLKQDYKFFDAKFREDYDILKK